jgi:hypothetical protein
MLLSVAPVLGAANNGAGGNSSTGAHGTSGNVKVHDAGTGAETTGTDNEPHVCAFWLEFTFDAPFEAGTWVVVSWEPTGDGSTVASGVYDTAGDGVDSSSVIEVSAGHYRVEWAANGATSSKKKTFWVDDGCDAPSSPAEESQPEGVTPPTDAPSSSPEEVPVEDVSQPEDVPPPTDAPSSPAEEALVEDVSQPEDVTPSEVVPPPTGAPDEESQSEGLVLGGQGTGPQDEAPADEAPASDEEDTAPVAGPVTGDEPSPDVAATAEDPAPADPGTPPAQDQLGAIAGNDEPAMSDTATAPAPLPSGLVVSIGLLLIAGHATVRRHRRSDREAAA